jgi:hypothetical protein
MSSDLYQQINSDKGSFERLLSRIPGFGGYLDQKARRTADRMLRDHITELLEQRIHRFARIEKRLLDGGGLAFMSRTQSAKSRLQTYHDRVKSAAPGYTGFFEAIKIGPDELDRLYGFDELQLVYADNFEAALDKFEEAVKNKEGIDAAIDALDDLAVQANEAYSRREDVLTNLNKS